ncbi:hypothetical protein ONV78_31755 [Hahella sp. CR1]|uniref:hypothetical protein n=1 Tax=Hahella sp. CR1 TaxID=2992807 RepID=UPI0024431455|nr:hypothetical protein [Hahella sp. CR1]MDG9672348.1 hypothetical protein [Hahella sp. CR1]
MKANTVEQAFQYSSNNGAAQYLPGINNKALKKLATQKGIVLEKPGGSQTKYFFYKSDEVVGYDNGEATQWIRAEITSGTYHGHPINENRLLKNYGIKEDKP